VTDTDVDTEYAAEYAADVARAVAAPAWATANLYCFNPKQHATALLGERAIACLVKVRVRRFLHAAAYA
jgi:hypothetical protein